VKLEIKKARRTEGRCQDLRKKELGREKCQKEEINNERGEDRTGSKKRMIIGMKKYGDVRSYKGRKE
jgi:hypothetical protein